ALGQRTHDREQRLDVTVLATGVREPAEPAAVEHQVSDHQPDQCAAEVTARHHQADHETDQLPPDPHGLPAWPGWHGDRAENQCANACISFSLSGPVAARMTGTLRSPLRYSCNACKRY